MSGLFPLSTPAGFTYLTAQSDGWIKGDVEYAVPGNAGSVEPQWTWKFSSGTPSTWLASVLALNPATGQPPPPPVANFTSSCAGLTCSFDASSSTAQASATYSWSWGDGTPAGTGKTASHPYAVGGSYNVTLTVTDAGGSSSKTQTVVPNTPPTVNAGPNQTGLIGLFYTENATFTDPDNGPWTYTIDWGDGSSSSGSTSSQGTISASHTYLLLGSYTIRVTVTDSLGASGSSTKVVTFIL
jgi:PKD repeat protein